MQIFCCWLCIFHDTSLLPDLLPDHNVARAIVADSDAWDRERSKMSKELSTLQAAMSGKPLPAPPVEGVANSAAECCVLICGAGGLLRQHDEEKGFISVMCGLGEFAHGWQAVALVL